MAWLDRCASESARDIVGKQVLDKSGGAVPNGRNLGGKRSNRRENEHDFEWAR